MARSRTLSLSLQTALILNNSSWMTQGGREHDELNRLARLLADTHRWYREERAGRERAERALAAERQRAEEAERRAVEVERRAGAIINQWLHKADSPSRRKRTKLRRR